MRRQNSVTEPCAAPRRNRSLSPMNATTHTCKTHVQALTLLIPLRCGRCTCGVTSRPCCMSHYISTRMCTRMVLPRGWAHSQIHRCWNVKVMRTYTGYMSHYISRPKVHAYVCGPASEHSVCLCRLPACMYVCLVRYQGQNR